MLNELDSKRNRIENIVKTVGFLVVGFLVAPYIFIAIKGLIGLFIAGVISFVIINFIPWFAAMIANWRLKALKYEASKNPIETLENQYQLKENALLAFRENIKTFHAEVENFRSVVQEHKEKYPDDNKYDDKFAKMVALLKLRANKYKQAQKKLANFAEVIERKRSEWKIVQASIKMDKAAGAGEDFVSKLMTDTALDSVQTNLNTAFAELEVSILDESVALQDNANSTQVVNETPQIAANTSDLLSLNIDIDSEPVYATKS